MFYRKRIEQIQSDITSIAERMKVCEDVIERLSKKVSDLEECVKRLNTISASTTKQEPPVNMSEIVRQWLGEEEANDG